MKRIFERIGFDIPTIQADSAVWQEKDLPLPLIVHVLIDNKYMHYVVIYGRI
ncbi:hypothetical protein LL277_15125 [Enterococcus faecalis]|nr:cysteine peptidase family C39 domain-containing protein [Enterococcus faecalis]MCC4085695.1 hypothetical protein [Enterococcus faecalis]